MNASSFEPTFWWFPPHSTVNSLSEDFIRKSLLATSCSSSNASPGSLWADWLIQLSGEIPKKSESENDTTISPLEIIAEGGANKSLLIQRCFFESNHRHDQRKVFIVAKYVALRFWKKLIENSKRKLSGGGGISSGFSLIGKDSLNLEKSLIREALNNLWLNANHASSKNYCRLVGIGWAISDQQVERKDDENKTPCLFFESLDFTLRQFLGKLISSFPEEIENEKQKRFISFIRNKLVQDIRKNVLDKISAPKSESKENLLFLSSHLDICPNNILVRVSSENNFDFVLADWECAVFSSTSNQQNSQDFLFDSIVAKFGTPPFADERILSIQEELVELQEEQNEKEKQKGENASSNEMKFHGKNKVIISIHHQSAKKSVSFHMTTQFVQSCDNYSFETILLNEWLPEKISKLISNRRGAKETKNLVKSQSSIEDIFDDEQREEHEKTDDQKEGFEEFFAKIVAEI